MSVRGGLTALSCWYNGHNLVALQDLLIGGQKCLCLRCNATFAVHPGRGICVPWDEDMASAERSTRAVFEHFRRNRGA